MDEASLELKAVFPQLKKWYGPAQKAKYGDLPVFWQQLDQWPNKRAVLKDFENDQQQKTTSNNGGNGRGSTKWSDYEVVDPIETLSLNDRKLILARLKLEDVVDNLNKVVLLSREAERDPNRSPSPEPVYNQDGIRTNTREVRMRNRFTEQKKDLIDELLRLKQMNAQTSISTSNGGGNGGGGGSSAQPALVVPGRQIQRKIYMPVKDFPGRNFIGLIIGPRGNTQKRLEGETGCKISIRGKGSVKAGRQAKPEDEADELHVIISGDTDDAVDLAAQKVDELLRPMDDQDNTHKQEQLKELAIYNGTYRDHDTCHHCGEKGHKQWECPKKRAAETVTGGGFNQGAGRGRGWLGPVVCKYCGERSHPSSDCPTLRVYPSMASGTGMPMPPMPSMGAGGPPQGTNAAGGVDESDFMDFWQDVSATPGAPQSGMSSGAPPAPVYAQQQQTYSHSAPPPSYPSAPYSNQPAYGGQNAYGGQSAYAVPPQAYPPAIPMPPSVQPPAYPAPPPMPEPPRQRY